MTKNLLIRIWVVCALGLFVDGFDLYVTSVAEPLFKKSFLLSPLWLGIAQAAAPIGAAVGAILIGYITDRVGRKTMLVFNFILFVVATLLSAISWNVYSLCFFRFLVGFGVGADYPICAAYLSEMAPNSSRGKLMAGAMFINCLASPVGIAVSYFIFSHDPHINAWRLMFAFGALPALLALLLRSRLPESFIWKANQRIAIHDKKAQLGYRPLFSPRYLKATIALCLSWALMDISYYSVGLFTPDILGALHLATTGNFVTDTKTIVENTIFLNIFVALGAFISIFVIDKVSRVGLQKMGFAGAFLGLFLLSSSYYLKIESVYPIILLGFLTYNVFVNMGPGTTTYLLPAEIYPSRIRGTGHGLASGIAKFGAFIGTIFLPSFQHHFGIHITMFVLSFTLLLGYFFTTLLKDYPVLIDVPVSIPEDTVVVT
ncbi:MAG: general substrate transporter [Gammaproteobacteria bacterium RIFCSPHIGHO2_12_FULL_36_30]|nr:MAG: general substrate transporter [Gammaproteobacteria bacterium RIFCSPHIGHO2_12_FULL_36_30]